MDQTTRSWGSNPPKLHRALVKCLEKARKKLKRRLSLKIFLEACYI